MRISLVVAASENGVIGSENAIPWKLPDDQKFFKALTLGHCIAMGRGTHESIGRLLPGRTTIILSREPGYAVEGATVVSDFPSALAVAGERGESELFVVGGEAIYRLALPRAERVHLTRVHARIEGDVVFPDPGRHGFRLAEETHHPADERHAYAFTIQRWERDV